VNRFTTFGTLDALSRGVNQILEVEGIDRVIVIGQSMSAIIAQLYFQRNFARVDAMVLTNAPAPRKEKNKKSAYYIIKIIPFFILRFAIKKKLNRLTDIAAAIPPEAEARCRFIQARLNDMLDNKLNKKTMINIMKLAFELNENEYTAGDFKEWNGRVLIITCEDDIYFKDSDSLTSNLPNAELYTFPKGLGHMAPMIHRDKFFSIINEFLKKV